jgi:hypothetical protein
MLKLPSLIAYLVMESVDVFKTDYCRYVLLYRLCSLLDFYFLLPYRSPICRFLQERC